MRNSTLSSVGMHRLCRRAANVWNWSALIIALVVAIMVRPLWAQQDTAAGKPVVASDVTALVNQPKDAKPAATVVVVSASAADEPEQIPLAVGAPGAVNPDLGAASTSAAVGRAPATAATTDPLPAEVDVAVAAQATLVPRNSAAVSKAAAPPTTTASTAATAKPAASPPAAAEVDGPAQ